MLRHVGIRRRRSRRKSRSPLITTARTLGDAAEASRARLSSSARLRPRHQTTLPELGTHAEFLGVCTCPRCWPSSSATTEAKPRSGASRATRVAFWRWVASWAAMVRRPSDLGYADGGYSCLPCATSSTPSPRRSTPTAARASCSRRRRRASWIAATPADHRSMTGWQSAPPLSTREPGEPWIVWCDLNAESERSPRPSIRRCRNYGSTTVEDKERHCTTRLRKIACWCRRQPFSASTGRPLCAWPFRRRDRFEACYQVIRRCWRSGQTRPVGCACIRLRSMKERRCNLKRKEATRRKAPGELARRTGDASCGSPSARREQHVHPSIASLAPANFLGTANERPESDRIGDNYALLYHADCVWTLPEMA